MITRLELENWRCFRKAAIDFEPLTVIVGPNASGKSTLLRALHPERPASQFAPWRNSKLPGLRRLEEDDDTGLVHEEGFNNLKVQGAWRPSHRLRLLMLDPAKMRVPNVLAPQRLLEADGSNVHNVFASMTRREQIEVGTRLAALVPVVGDVESRPSHGEGRHWLLFQDRWSESTWYTPADVSDGTLYMLAYLLLAYEQKPPDVLCIEEPERGLHPYLLEQVMGLLRKLTTGEIGKKKIQVVLATQSPELLEHARPEEVRFLNRDPSDGSVIVEAAPTSEPEWREAFDTYERSLRGMWLSGNLGGVPGA